MTHSPSLASIPDTYVDAWDLFEWDSASRTFTGQRSLMDGFTGEVFDGEGVGFGIEGKTGEVLYFRVTGEDVDRAGITYWTVEPACQRGRAVIDRGRIVNR